MEFADLVRARRMTRAFAPEPVQREVLERCVDLASRSPSAGKTQGWRLVAIEGEQTREFWNLTLPTERRSEFAWPGLLEAPLVLLPVALPDDYVARYAEPDKAATGLGSGADAWAVPYWTVDASFAVMTLLLALQDEGLGALFFGVFRGEAEVRARYGIPVGAQLLGAIATGKPADSPTRKGRSSGRRRLAPSEIIGWGGLN